MKEEIPSRLTELTQATLDAVLALEVAETSDQPRCLAALQRSFHALRQVETSHVEPLLLTQSETQGLALACRKARSRVTPLLDELDRTSPADPSFSRHVASLVTALRRLLDRTRELLSNLDRLLSPEHRALLLQALEHYAPEPV